MSHPDHPLRLHPSLRAAAERIAAAEGTSLNQFINVAVAEKLSALETDDDFRTRAVRGRREDFLAYLDGAADEEPDEGDTVR